MKARSRHILWLVLALAASAQDRRIVPIAVQRKQALIIGNSAYSSAPLQNPANDATAMDAALRKLGFEVRTLRNLDLPHMEAAIDKFTAGLSSGSLAFFYYSGHGIQVNYSNYLLPVDFAASSEIDVKYKAYPATRVQEKMEASGARLRVLVLDACRNNPFRFRRDALGGLTSMPVNAEGTLIAFATGDGNTADDNRAEANGLYTKYLIPALQTPGLALREAFQKAKEDVFVASGKAQNPSIYENIVGAYYLVSGPPNPAVRVDAAAETWALIKDSTSPEDFESFAATYPNSDLAGGARIRAAQLRRASAAPAPRLEAPELPPGTQAGSAKVNPVDGQRYLWIPPGTFMMGCSPGDSECEDVEKPAHEVTLTRGFWMGQTSVTVGAWKRYAQATGKAMPPEKWRSWKVNAAAGNDSLPVVAVTWDEAASYCGWAGMRLPTEAEWEWAARAGTAGARYGNLDEIAWYGDNSGRKRIDSTAISSTGEDSHGERLYHNNGNGLKPVGQKLPNAYGLYDMLGNVLQWMAGWYQEDYYQVSDKQDPSGPPDGESRALRGGAWASDPGGVRVSYRAGSEPGFRSIGFGVRCVGN